MSGKVKMRCGRCGKTFKSMGAKQIYCPECAAKERAARQTQKQAGATASASAAPAPPPPKIVGPGAGVLIPGATPPISTTNVPPDSGLFGAAARASERTQHAPHHDGQRAGHQPEHGHEASATHTTTTTTTGKPSTQPAAGAAGKHGQAHGAHPHHDGHPSAAPQPPREPREPRAVTFTLTDEMRQRIEARYLELATPVEFDGIRTQLAQELSVPKGAIKRVVSELRGRMQLPSWWELQAYRGTDADLERIRAAYLPLLPVPPVGVHKQMAENLGLDPVMVYQGIRRIRAEMRLPQYNPPESHAQQHGGEPSDERPTETTATSKTSEVASTAGTTAGTTAGNAPVTGQA